MKKRITSFLTALVMLVSVFPITAHANTQYDFKDDVWLVFRDSLDLQTYVVDNTSISLTLKDLEFEVFVHRDGGYYLNDDKYILHVGFAEGYDAQTGRPLLREVEAPYSLSDDPDGEARGWTAFSVYAEAAEGSGYTGATEIYEFIIADKYSINDNISEIDFGEIYKRDTAGFSHPFFSVPLNRLQSPRVYGVSGELLDPSLYTITYFERGDKPSYSLQKPLSGMPGKLGKYFARVEGKEPYYGVSYIDFDIVEAPELYVMSHGSEKKYYDNNTVFIAPDGSVDICFKAKGKFESMIIGWVSNDLTDVGFELSDDPVWFDGDNNAYAHISANGLKPGTRGRLIYNWYRFSDVFHDDSYHWDTAVPTWSGVINIEVEPQTFDYLLGDVDGDSDITITDATVIQRACADMDVSVDKGSLLRGDIDGNGAVDISDATFIQRWLADVSLPFDVKRPMIL